MGGSRFHLPCLAACPGQMGCSWGGPAPPLPFLPFGNCCLLVHLPSPFLWLDIETGGRGSDSPEAGKVSTCSQSFEITPLPLPILPRPPRHRVCSACPEGHLGGDIHGQSAAPLTCPSISPTHRGEGWGWRVPGMERRSEQTWGLTPTRVAVEGLVRSGGQLWDHCFLLGVLGQVA